MPKMKTLGQKMIPKSAGFKYNVAVTFDSDVKSEIWLAYCL